MPCHLIMVHPYQQSTTSQDEFLCFLKNEIRSGKFTPRKGVPMQVTPLCREQLDVYFALLKGPSLKRKHDDQ